MFVPVWFRFFRSVPFLPLFKNRSGPYCPASTGTVEWVISNLPVRLARWRLWRSCFSGSSGDWLALRLPSRCLRWLSTALSLQPMPAGALGCPSAAITGKFCANRCGGAHPTSERCFWPGLPFNSTLGWPHHFGRLAFCLWCGSIGWWWFPLPCASPSWVAFRSFELVSARAWLLLQPPKIDRPIRDRPPMFISCPAGRCSGSRITHYAEDARVLVIAECDREDH